MQNGPLPPTLFCCYHAVISVEQLLAVAAIADGVPPQPAVLLAAAAAAVEPLLLLLLRFGNGLGALVLMLVPLLCSMFCGNACVTSTSRYV
jgi:SpoU rRNA methylase family enzyme